ncbi:MAG: CDP-alcohol phosphatidyltransferase family protein [Acidobacteriota bacterium]
MPGPFIAASRELHGLTAAAERRLLVRLAGRLPHSVHADHLTALAAAAMAAAGLLYALAPFWPPALLVVNFCLLANWFGDSLDGTLARVRGEERPRYGFYVDHVLDAAGITLLVAGMAVSGLLSPLVAAVFLAAYLLVCVEVYLATYCLASFRMSFAGIGPTELRLLVAAGNVSAYVDPVVRPFGVPLRLFDLGAGLGAAALGLVFAWSAVRNGRRLFREEPRQRR